VRYCLVESKPTAHAVFQAALPCDNCSCFGIWVCSTGNDPESHRFCRRAILKLSSPLKAIIASDNFRSFSSILASGVC